MNVEHQHALWTIVTPTTGRRSILNLKEALKRERLNYVHLIMMDSKREVDSLEPCDLEDDRTFVYDIKHPLYPEPDARMDVYLRAIGIMMARTPYIRCCDDDVWPEPDHLTTITKFMESHNLDFTWCYRRMLTRELEPLGVDKFEAIGEINRFGYNLLDNSSIFFNKKASNVLAQVFLKNPVYGDDRLTWNPLHKFCQGKLIPEVLTNHMCQPELETFFRENCTPEKK